MEWRPKMTRNTGCTTDQPTPAGPAPAIILDGLSAAVARAQSALLSGRLPELENSLGDQLELCRQLRSCLPGISLHSSPMFAVSPAYSAQQQLRIFSATLRRMQRTLTAFHNALQASSLTYAPPTTSGKTWGR